MFRFLIWLQIYRKVELLVSQGKHVQAFRAKLRKSRQGSTSGAGTGVDEVSFCR
jgi:hypothetical protein